jgi:hypothetical protein
MNTLKDSVTKKTLLILAMFFLANHFILFSQDAIAVWPISGQPTGNNIIYKPTDFIGSEKNYCDLFIGAPEGTPVLAPISGTITNFGYHYSGSLFTSQSFNVTEALTTDIVEYDKKQRQIIATKNGLNPQFISISIGISGVPGENYWISGLRPVGIFKTGQKIKKGDVIGYVGYCYKLITEPCIELSRSIHSKGADPMSPFGIKSSFVPWKATSIKPAIPVEELVADFNIFRQSLEEGHPGLYDYTSKQNMDAAFEKVLKSITQPMSSAQFLDILRPIVLSIRDSHTHIDNVTQSAQSQSSAKTEFVNLPVTFGFERDTLVVCQTLPAYQHLLGKQIVKINNDSAQALLQKIPITSNGEGYIDGSDYMKLRFFLNYKYYYKYKKGDVVTLYFSDGTQADLAYQVIDNPHRYLPARRREPANNASVFDVKAIDESTTYLRIRSFGFTDTDQDSIQRVIKGLCDAACQNLIIDVRNNPGGNNSFNKLFSLLANEPYQSTVASVVKSNGRYPFLKYTDNYVDTFVLFPEYKKIPNKEGYRIQNDTFDKPDKHIHYSGNVYVLTNEYSFSAATLFAALVHKYKRGKIVGRETGTSYYQMNAVNKATVMLKNSGLQLRVPLIKVIFDDEMDCSIPWGRGVIPDHQVRWTYNEFFNADDPILNHTLNLIRSAKSN